MMSDDEHVVQLGVQLSMLYERWTNPLTCTPATLDAARQLYEVIGADDILGAFAQRLAGDKSEGIDRLRGLIRTCEWLDFGGLTTRDADSLAALLWIAGYRETEGNDS